MLLVEENFNDPLSGSFVYPRTSILENVDPIQTHAQFDFASKDQDDSPFNYLA